MKVNLLLCHLILLLFPLFQGNAQPNFVIIVLDDQGWTGSSIQMDANIPTSKSDFYLTPALEALAKDGMTFTQGYAPAPKCSPSRNSILTGKTPARNNFTDTDNMISTGKVLIEPSINTMLNGTDTTYTEWLKSTGLDYRTAHFGKWHQGNMAASSPANNGFDLSDGSTNNANGDHEGTVQADPKYIFDMTNRSIAFIQNAVSDGVPFVLHLSHYAVHVNIEARQETIDLYNDPVQRPRGTIHAEIEYAAMTEDTDTGIGQLLTAMSNLGIDDNTYVIFLSDNGGQLNTTSNFPLSFGKTFLTEGGIRVPFIIKGPGIPANTYNTEPIIGYDIFPTIAELSGGSTALPSHLDGQSLVPLLKGDSFIRLKPLYFHSPHYDANVNKRPQSALIDGKNKLVVDYETGQFFLYDLSADIGESNDLSTSLPALTRAYTIDLRDYLKSVDASMPSLDPSHGRFSGSGSDVDNDGLDDAWELRELLTYAYDPLDDPDDDGINNLAEYNAGSDPYHKNSSVGISVIEQGLRIKIYPNPTDLYLNIELGDERDIMNDFKGINIYSQTGALVLQSNQSKSINISHLPKGIYLIHIDFNGKKISKMIVVE